MCQQQRELRRQRYRLLVTSVVTELPLGGLGIEDGVKGELRQARLDITRCCGAVAGEDISPVSLSLHKEVLLSHLYKSVADGGVAVRVELHGVTNDVSHLVKASVVHSFHGVHDASLYGFEAVNDMRNSAV